MREGEVMKNWLLFILVIFILSSFFYFNQDRMALYIQDGGDAGTYTFTPFNNVKSTRINDSNVSFIFNNEKQIAEKIIDKIVVEKYKWLGERRLYLVTDAQDNVLREYLYENKFSYLPYGMIVNGTTYHFIYDPMRSLRLVLDEKNNIIKVINYDHKGMRIKESNRSFIVDYSYAGGINEPTSKLIFFLEGAYNTITGKWVTRIKSDDVIQNLRLLNRLESDDVYECKDTLDTYYHSYLCVKGKCGGLYATEYLNYFNAKGHILDNSNYFKPDRCSLVTLPSQYHHQVFASCVKEKISVPDVKPFDVIKHNCHDEVADIINACKAQAHKGFL
jgi:hypothetical protein